MNWPLRVKVLRQHPLSRRDAVRAKCYLFLIPFFFSSMMKTAESGSLRIAGRALKVLLPFSLSVGRMFFSIGLNWSEPVRLGANQ